MAKWLVTAALVAGCTAEVPAIDGSDVEADATDDSQQVAPFVDLAKPDADADGIPDVLEEQLLRRYRPFYRFSKGESFRPADAVAEIENAQLVRDLPDYDGTSDPLSDCGRAGDHHLVPAESLYTCRPDASLIASPGKTMYALNLDNSRYHGVAFDEAKLSATGLYGHVAPAEIGGHEAYKIEYWQFFAFNNQNISILFDDSIADHEGDWTSVQLWFDRVEHRIVQARYLIHGKAVTFAFAAAAPSCTDCTLELHGDNYNPNPKNFFDDTAAYSNNSAEVYIDEHRFKHVVVYIEQGAHEFWPGPWGHAAKSFGPLSFGLDAHDGEGEQYLVPAPARALNLGEVDHPISRDGRVILPFNGFWGSTNTREAIEFGPTRRSPVGPALHCSWKWPDGTTISACEG